MIGEGLFLVSHGFFYGGSFGNFFFQLEQLGFFTFILPFLIIFSLIFGVLSRTQMFGTGKTIYAIVALSVSLMAIQFGFVSQFFSDIFPLMGIWLSVILVFFIIFGLLNPSNTWNKGLLILAAMVVFTVVLVQTFGYNWYTGYWIPQYWPVLGVIALVVVGIGAIIANTPEANPLNIPQAIRNAFGPQGFGGQWQPN